MSDRCEHDMPPGTCVLPECEHYDSQGSLNRNPRSKFHRLPKREKPKLPCGHCEKLPRLPGKDYCQECYDRFSAPKKCLDCPAILSLRPGGKFLEHVTRVRCHACQAAAFSRNPMVRRRASGG